MTNRDDAMSSNARNPYFFVEREFELVGDCWREDDLWEGGGEKLLVDSDCTRLWGTVELPWRGAVVTLRKVAFFSRKAALTAQKEASCCWWDSC